MKRKEEIIKTVNKIKAELEISASEIKGVKIQQVKAINSANIDIETFIGSQDWEGVERRTKELLRQIVSLRKSTYN